MDIAMFGAWFKSLEEKECEWSFCNLLHTIAMHTVLQSTLRFLLWAHPYWAVLKPKYSCPPMNRAAHTISEWQPKRWPQGTESLQIILTTALGLPASGKGNKAGLTQPAVKLRDGAAAIFPEQRTPPTHTHPKNLGIPKWKIVNLTNSWKCFDCLNMP